VTSIVRAIDFWSAQSYWRGLRRVCWKNRFCEDAWTGHWNGPRIGRCLASMVSPSMEPIVLADSGTVVLR
jgi:hypothetical protein